VSVIDWALYSERAVGRGSVTYTDVINRPLREVMTISSQDPDASFPGFSLVGHTHDAAAVVSGTLAPARGGTGLSSPTAGALLIAAGVAAMTLLAPGASGQVVKSNGTAWGSAAIVSADISDLASAATGITKVGTVSVGAWQATQIIDTYLATIGTAGKVANSATTATAANAINTIVARDGSGNFAAGVITASFTGALTGNAATATKLAASVNINGVAFDGSVNVTVPAAAATLTGTTLAANVVASSLTGVGILTAGTWQATIVAPLFGGTGVANTNTITLGGNINTAAAFATVGGGLTLTVTGATNVTLPTSGTLVNTAVTTLSSLNTVGTITTGVWNATAIVDTYLATITAANKVATGAVAPGTFAAGAFAFQGAVSGITTLATSSTINGQTISSAASFTGSVTATTHIRTGGTVTAHVASSIALDYAGGFGRVFVEGPDPATNGSFLVTLARSDGSAGIAAITATSAAVTIAPTLNANTGVQIGGAATLAASAAALLSYEAPVMRIYVGDGTGYSTRFTKRVGSVNTDVVTITDLGAVTIANGLTVVAGTTAVQALTATSGTFTSGGNSTVTTLSSFNGSVGNAAINRMALGNSSAVDTFVLDIYGGGHATRPGQVWLATTVGISSLILATNNTPALTLAAATQSATFAADVSIPATKHLFVDGGGDTYIQESSANIVLAVGGGNNLIQLDGSSSPTSTQTRLSVAVGGGVGLQLVTLGAVDSGGTGFRLLRVPN
jgi:hypothetical protein